MKTKLTTIAILSALLTCQSASAADLLDQLKDFFRKPGEQIQQQPQAGQAATSSSQQVVPTGGSISGVYVSESKSRSKDGKGQMQDEFSKFTYTIQELGKGRAKVKYTGDGQSADARAHGGLMGGSAEQSGIATLKNGVWVMKSKFFDQPCQVRFMLTPPTLKHLSHNCRDAGMVWDFSWPQDNEIFKQVSATPAAPQSVPVAAAGPDWTPIFKSWENGCDFSPVFLKFMNELVASDEKKNVYLLGKVVLPEQYKAAFGQPTMKNEGDYTSFNLPVTAGTYYGIPVNSIYMAMGNENGIASYTLGLGAPKDTAQKALKAHKVRFKSKKSEMGDPVSAGLFGDKKSSGINCDFSN